MHTATRWFCLLTLQQLPVLLTVQSCKNDLSAQTTPGDKESRPRYERPVFGGKEEVAASPTGPQSESRNSTRKDGPPQIKKPSPHGKIPRPQIRRSRSVPAAQPGEPPHSWATDRARTVAPQVNRSQPSAPAPANRFLHYQPPGSRISDPGELASRSVEPRESSSADGTAVRDLLVRWADTFLSGNVRGHMNLYAPTLDYFSGSANVSREAVQAARQRLLAAPGEVRRFEMYDVRLLPAHGGGLYAEFRIESDAGNRGLAGWHRLELRRVGGGAWKIHGEEELRTLSRRSR